MPIKTSFHGSPLCCFIHTPCIVLNSNATFAFPTPHKSQLLSPKIWETRDQPGPRTLIKLYLDFSTLYTFFCALKRSKENILGLLGSKYYQNEERSETNPLVYGRKRENQRYQSYQGSNILHFYN